MNAVPYAHALALAAVLFTIGLAGVLARRNLVFVLMSIEIMLNAGGIALVAAGARWGEADGQALLLFVLAAAAAEVAVGLALVLRIRLREPSLDADLLGAEERETPGRAREHAGVRAAARAGHGVPGAAGAVSGARGEAPRGAGAVTRNALDGRGGGIAGRVGPSWMER